MWVEASPAAAAGAGQREWINLAYARRLFMGAGNPDMSQYAHLVQVELADGLVYTLAGYWNSPEALGRLDDLAHRLNDDWRMSVTRR